MTKTSVLSDKNVPLLTVTLDFRQSIFPFWNQELFDLRNIYVVNLKTGHPKKKMPYVGEFAIWDLS